MIEARDCFTAIAIAYVAAEFMGVLISAVLPIALVALVGFMIGRTTELEMKTLARVSIYAMLPALVFNSLAGMTLAWNNAIAILLTFFLNTGLLYLLVLVISWGLKFSPNDQKSLITTTLFANVGNMGLPFVLFALGEAGLERAVVYLVGSSLMIVSIFPIVLKGAGLREGLKLTVRLPVFWATIAGVIVQLLGGELPQAIARGSKLLGAGAIPLALLTLGIQLSQTKFKFGWYEWFGAGLRLLVSPLLGLMVGKLLGLSGLDLQVLVLQSAMPVAVNSLIWATELGGYRVRVARTIVLSTLVSLGTLPGILWLLTRAG